jgi:intron-binding protein aquarius
MHAVSDDQDGDDHGQGGDEAAARKRSSDRALVTEVLLSAFSERESQVEAISQMPLYPDEQLLWGDALQLAGSGPDGGGGVGHGDDEDHAGFGGNEDTGSMGSGLTAMVPGGSSGRLDRPLALPKLSLQFLTFHDYLLRAFQLFRLEAAYEIRQDVGDAVRDACPENQCCPLLVSRPAGDAVRGCTVMAKKRGWRERT